jgi:DNA end-binding protein Ku
LLEIIEIESTHTIEIDSFVPRSEIDQRFFETPYYITPNDPVGQEAFGLSGRALSTRSHPIGPASLNTITSN